MLQDIYSANLKMYIHLKIHLWLFGEALLIISPNWNQPKYSSKVEVILKKKKKYTSRKYMIESGDENNLSRHLTNTISASDPGQHQEWLQWATMLTVLWMWYDESGTLFWWSSSPQLSAQSTHETNTSQTLVEDILHYIWPVFLKLSRSSKQGKSEKLSQTTGA